MTTKIDAYQANVPRPISTANAPTRTTLSTAATGNSSSAPVSAVSQNDRVQLTGDAVQLQQFEKTLSAIPSTDRSRVDSIRQSLANGTFQTDPQAIASKLLRFEGELSQT
ncbi:MAG: flagellar biosynthesis anti-sigma factor FlgM [Nevskia sp.]|jgi:negative regulator of flagellin synthesis FlgM|nr:flagellar biosynthesis anti-sigma factor FlgM [Nevskia sp.]MCK9384146.1 flagellar biosynthesis anti-sigma factor FlgM [Nevskia sp.]